MRMIRVITKCGEERMTPLNGATYCAGWWNITRMAGAILGDNWCCPFDEIAFAEVVESNITDNPTSGSLQTPPFPTFGQA